MWTLFVLRLKTSLARHYKGTSTLKAIHTFNTAYDHLRSHMFDTGVSFMTLSCSKMHEECCSKYW